MANNRLIRQPIFRQQGGPYGAIQGLFGGGRGGGTDLYGPESGQNMPYSQYDIESRNELRRRQAFERQAKQRRREQEARYGYGREGRAHERGMLGERMEHAGMSQANNRISEEIAERQKRGQPLTPEIVRQIREKHLSAAGIGAGTYGARGTTVNRTGRALPGPTNERAAMMAAGLRYNRDTGTYMSPVQMGEHQRAINQERTRQAMEQRARAGTGAPRIQAEAFTSMGGGGLVNAAQILGRYGLDSLPANQAYDTDVDKVARRELMRALNQRSDMTAYQSYVEGISDKLDKMAEQAALPAERLRENVARTGIPEEYAAGMTGIGGGGYAAATRTPAESARLTLAQQQPIREAMQPDIEQMNVLQQRLLGRMDEQEQFNLETGAQAAGAGVGVTFPSPANIAGFTPQGPEAQARWQETLSGVPRPVQQPTTPLRRVPREAGAPAPVAAAAPAPPGSPVLPSAVGGRPVRFPEGETRSAPGPQASPEIARLYGAINALAPQGPPAGVGPTGPVGPAGEATPAVAPRTERAGIQIPGYMNPRDAALAAVASGATPEQARAAAVTAGGEQAAAQLPPQTFYPGGRVVPTEALPKAGIGGVTKPTARTPRGAAPVTAAPGAATPSVAYAGYPMSEDQRKRLEGEQIRDLSLQASTEMDAWDKEPGSVDAFADKLSAIVSQAPEKLQHRLQATIKSVLRGEVESEAITGAMYSGILRRLGIASSKAATKPAPGETTLNGAAGVTQKDMANSVRDSISSTYKGRGFSRGQEGRWVQSAMESKKVQSFIQSQVQSLRETMNPVKIAEAITDGILKAATPHLKASAHISPKITTSDLMPVYGQRGTFQPYTSYEQYHKALRKTLLVDMKKKVVELLKPKE